MKIIVSMWIGLVLIGCSHSQKMESTDYDTGRNIVKIQAISSGGKQNLGSGVVIAANTIATNCHITRNSSQAYLIEPDRLYPILTQAALPELDVCILKTENLSLPAAEIADENSVNVGDDIVLSGYPFALGLRMKQGKVKTLHPHENGQIIEVNAGFNHGASGGGVFDSNGKLIGLMTFMGQEDGEMHFYAIPAMWLLMGLEQEFVPLKPFSDHSFWEKGSFVKQLKN